MTAKQYVRIHQEDGSSRVRRERDFKPTYDLDEGETYTKGLTAYELSGDEIVAYYEMGLEGANYHSMTSLPDELYASLKEVFGREGAEKFMQTILDRGTVIRW